MLGTDASPRIKDIGPARAFKYIANHGTIESVLEENPKVKARIPEGYLDMVASARQVFMDLPPVPSALDLEQGLWREEEVVRWLEEEHGVRLDVLSLQKEDGWVGHAWGGLPRSYNRVEPMEVDLEGEAEMAMEIESSRVGPNRNQPNWGELVREVMAEMEEMEIGHMEDPGPTAPFEAHVEQIYPDEVRDAEGQIWEEVVEEEMKRR
jgi:5'-3' exonuclease